jgi:hypothetical protein
MADERDGEKVSSPGARSSCEEAQRRCGSADQKDKSRGSRNLRGTLVTPKLESLAAYVASLIAIKSELSSEAEIREELIQAIEAFQAELRAARKRRQAAA